MPMDATALALPVLIGLIAVALVFDFLNGLHDAANSIATVVATRVLTAADRGGVGSVLQLHRLRGVRAARRADRRHRHRRAGHRGRRRHLRRIDGRHRLERDHVGARHPVEQQPRAHRRARGRRDRQGRSRRDRREGACRSLPPASSCRRCSDSSLAQLIVLIVSWAVAPSHAVRRRPPLSRAAAVFGGDVFARARRQRRAEDHGHHRGAPLLARDAARRVPRPVLGRDHLPGGDGARHATRAAGAS